MEDVLRRSGHRVVGEEEKRVDSVVDPKEKIVANKEPAVTNKEGSSLGSDSKASSSSLKKEDDQLESARAEMGELREENQRLKMYLDRIMKDYQTLQMRFYEVVQQEAKKSKHTSNDDQEVEEPLVSLTLGRIFSSDSKNDEKIKSSSRGKEEEEIKEDLSLGLEFKFEVSKSEGNESLANTCPAANSTSEEQKEEPGETWPPSKVAKTMGSGDEEILQQNPLKKAKVSVRARCDTPTMNDGCQWRKYGQKIAKGNPCPRAYYRCTVAPSCPVRKQVQRCAEDMSILITTYEGTHNHPLPVSATAMASTTSAAVSMLLSGSSSSYRPGSSAPSTITAANSNLHGLNFYLTDSSKTKQFYLPNPSLSSSPSYPTITLDLTTAPNSSSSHLSWFTSNYPSSTRYSSTSLSFGSSESNSMSWANGLLSYGSTQPYIKNQIGALNLGRQPTENIYQSYTQKNTASSTPQQTLPADTIAAATKAITADPSFQSALAAAFTSIIGNGNSGGTGGASQVGGGDNFVQKLKWSDHFPVASKETVKGSGCASSYLNKSSTTSSQPGSLIFLPPSLPFSSSKSASASPGDDREHNN